MAILDDKKKLLDALAKAQKGMVKKVIRLQSTDIEDIKKALKDYGYQYVLGNKAYKSTADMHPDGTYLAIKRQGDMYYTTVTKYERV